MRKLHWVGLGNNPDHALPKQPLSYAILIAYSNAPGSFFFAFTALREMIGDLMIFNALCFLDSFYALVEKGFHWRRTLRQMCLADLALAER